MVVFAHTDAHTILGKLTNGRKIVSTLVTVTDANNGTATSITISPLVRVVKFMAAPQLNGAPAGIIGWTATGTNNIIIGTPAASANGDVFEIISIGI